MNIDLVRENIQAARNQLRYVRGQEGIVANIEDRLISALRLLGETRPAVSTGFRSAGEITAPIAANVRPQP